ncbi:DUF4214 domain-containing protein [Massilia forsythiae]|uniref:DUF4214 domain-containing protein n=1 Tax=Massilia forsythiae TaxID=2728020 RepID=A0A7Z2ZS62_9BURK|nr:DUF4214 domain-containing protein [Massilia forsythiae]QJE00148.1 DUF4214 domain-containing protein [Massilia forsythiae]
MATVSDVTKTPLSGLNYIDALLDSGPDWNFLTDSSRTPLNTLSYTFSVASGNEDAQSAAKNFTGTQQAFTASQQAAVRSAFAYITKLTGIEFVETAIGTNAQIHLANANLIGSNVTGLASWHSSYTYSGTQLASYDADVYVYLDNVEWGSQNGNLAAGGNGYETLLHELGHALGLKHPFETTSDNSATLPASQDNTVNTLMSYTDVGGPYTTYSQDDVAALMWLYGGDGLRGALGINSATGGRYLAGTSGADTLTGTDADDTFEGNGGNDMINGGNGNDTAVFHGVRNNYNFSVLANGDLVVASKDGSDGTDTLSSIETLRFADLSMSHADVVATATGSPMVPQLTVTKNANGYASGNMPLVSGSADANAVIKVFTTTNVLVGTATADAKGLWSLKLSPFNDGMNYQIYAIATNGAGQTSAASDAIAFNIDATAPIIPTSSLSYTQGSNQATLSGTGEAGTTIQLLRNTDYIEISETKVGTDGKWSVTTSPLPNGSYGLVAVSVDAAGNATSSGTTLSFNVANTANITGTAGNDKLTATAGSTAIDGQGGIDTVTYNGARANFTVAKEVWGYGVTDNAGNGGHDALINVERLHFNDADVALDINGNAGQMFRLYQAAFDRPAEAGGLGYWINAMDIGHSLQEIALSFTKSAEFIGMYGSNPSTSDFVTNLYHNVLHRDPEAGGFNFWVDSIDNKGASREQVLAFFSESPENQAQVIGSIQNGVVYEVWKG